MSEQSNEPTPATQVALPDVPEVRAWIDTTQAKRAALQVRADRLRERFDPLRKQLAAIERSIKVLDHFLGQVTLAEEPAVATRRQTSRRGKPLLAEGQWSRNHAACQECGTTTETHKAQGYCRLCYGRATRRTAGVPQPLTTVS